MAIRRISFIRTGAAPAIAVNSAAAFEPFGVNGMIVRVVTNAIVDRGCRVLELLIPECRL
jgi:hypothetical protein